MAAIFTGLGAGLARGSGSILGAGGTLGSAATGRSGDALSVNAATGNLVISRQDEFLSGPGLDVGISRTYNGTLEASDGDNGDKWQMSSARRVFGLEGAANTAGGKVKRLAGDGSVSTYLYETRGGVAAYWNTDGAGTHDKLTVSSNRDLRSFASRRGDGMRRFGSIAGSIWMEVGAAIASPMYTSRKAVQF